MSTLKYIGRVLFGKHLIYTSINVLGLTIGVTSVILAFLYAKDEFGFDKFHPNHQNIYRIVVDWNGDGVVRNWARSSPPIAEMIESSIPQIDPVVRIRKNPGTDLFSIGEKDFYEPNLLIADQEFFDLFGFKLKSGHPENVLKDKYSLVISESAAIKYFNDPSPIGKVIRYDNQFDLTISGIAYDCPKNSHIYFDFVASNALLEEIFNERRLTHWGQFDYYTYGRLADKQTASKTVTALNEQLKESAPEWVPEKMQLALQPIADIHLKSDRHSELVPNSSSIYSYVFIGVAFLILAMAVFNYLNLTLSLLLNRNKEIALRLALGSGKWRLFRLLITEAIYTSLFAGFVSILIVYLTMPMLEQLTGKVLIESLTVAEWVWLFTFLTALGLLSGSFPAIFILKNYSNLSERRSIRTKKHLRNAILIGQLSISSLLLIGVLTANRQLSFLYQQSIGFSDESVLVIPIKDRSSNKEYQTIARSLTSVSGVNNVSFSSTTPGSNNSLTYTYTFQGSERGETPMAVVIADENYLELYQIELSEGRFLDGNTGKDLQDIIINESAIEMLELDDAIGTNVVGKVTGTVVGVVKDFQLNSLHGAPEPMILYNFLPTLRYVSVKLNRSEPEVLEQISKVWANFYPEYPIEFSFLREENQKLYSFEKGVQSALMILQPISGLLIFVGMVAFTFLFASERAKEFAIRKSMGANSLRIAAAEVSGMWGSWLISLLVVSIVGFYVIQTWFQNFQYHIPVTVDLLLLPILSIILLITLTMGFVIVFQLRHPPVKYLRFID